MTTRGHHGLLLASGDAFLDDLAVSPRCVLSMKKKLIRTATSALRVRESGGNTEQDIGFSGTLVNSSALASFVGSNSGFLKTLYDQTGNGEDAVQTTSANQPRLVNAGAADAMATFDGSNDSLSISSLTAGAAQLHIYMKFKMPDGPGVKILLEQSANYNSNSQSGVVYYDSTPLYLFNVAMRNTTGGSDFRLQYFNIASAAVALTSVFMDRSLTGSDEIKVWKDGSALTPTVNGTPAEQTGVFSSYDLYIGGRAGSSLFANMGLESLAIYDADTSSIRSSIEALMA